VNLSDDAMTGDLERVLARIVKEVSTHNPGLIFVDSFRSVVFASEQAGSPQMSLQLFVQHLGMLMSTWQATTFLIGEYFNETDANPVFTVADGLIWLRQSVQRNSMVRKIEIMKMRGQPCLPGLHTFRIDRSGVRVFAPAQHLAPGLAAPNAPTAPSATAPGSRVLTGVSALDTMLGGGLPRGYSLLVAGPSGSGKTVLAASFLAEGARCGETGVVVAFEQQPNQSRNPLLAELIASELVSLIDSREPDLSIDEIVLLIFNEVRRLGATRVVLDSLSGFELALAPTFCTDFRESLLGLVTALSRARLTVLMTSELEDRYTDLRFSPYGAAFLTDAIIVQRYIEVNSRLERVMAVVKVRASPHSKALCLYDIHDDGIHIGAMLADHEGLLWGHPTYKASSDRLPPINLTEAG
jgi:circadian clock protein KaiC